VHIFDLAFFHFSFSDSKLLREHDVISESFISDWLSNLITFKFIFLFGKNIVLHEFVPVLFSFVEQNGVSKMKKRNIVVMEIVMHDTIINDKLLGELAIRSVVIELQGFDEFVLTVSVPLESFDDWKASLVGL
jgi:hypothetical protein